MNEDKKLAYLPMAVDMIHTGHLNIIKEAGKLGATVMVGCYSDEAIASYKRLPFMSFEQRKEVIGNIKGVDIVVKQVTRDLEENIRKYKPDYVVHGTDWKDGALSKSRERTIEVLAEWGGCLVEPEYTQGISSTDAHKYIKNAGLTLSNRQSRLRKLLNVKKHIRAIEVHNGISALIVENTIIQKTGKPTQSYDILWLDSMVTSFSKGKLNTGIVDFTTRCSMLNEIIDAVTMPIIFDLGVCQSNNQLVYSVQTLEKLGVSAIVIDGGNQSVDSDVDLYCKKIDVAKKSQVERDFMIIVKIEDLDISMDNIIINAQKYIETGADSIIFYSSSDERIMEFCYRIKQLESSVPITIVPPYDSKTSEEEFIKSGSNLIVYCDNLLRASFSAMSKTAYNILENKCDLFDVENSTSISDIEKIIPNNGK